MALTEDDVRHVAKLSRLALGDDEISELRGELETIVGYVDQLKAVNTDGVEGIAHVTGAVNVTREDAAKHMLPIEDVLANGPQTNDQAFLVPKAVER